MDRPSGAVAASMAAAAIVLASACEALGCPSCAPGRAARAAVFGPGFWPQLFLVALPLLVLGAIGALFYRIGIEREARPWRRERTGGR